MVPLHDRAGLLSLFAEGKTETQGTRDKFPQMNDT